MALSARERSEIPRENPLELSTGRQRQKKLPFVSWYFTECDPWQDTMVTVGWFNAEASAYSTGRCPAVPGSRSRSGLIRGSEFRRIGNRRLRGQPPHPSKTFRKRSTVVPRVG